MDSLQQNRQEEMAYLDKTLEFIRSEMDKETAVLGHRLRSLINSGKEMWEDSVHYTDDFEKLVEVSQHLGEITSQTAGYSNKFRQVEKYKRMLGSPYFGRFDFAEDGLGDSEKVYIGLYNIMDSENYDVLVYDWRTPVSSIFYRFEPGRASYNAPSGEIAGEVLLKRQYKIQNSELKYFFDCSIRIGDEILQEVLSRNSSSRMRNIVETIQREQDIIIRDTRSELVIVQGVAGSGKTSIALHRIAFLLYEGMSSNISSNNIIIVSPNCLFSKYISDVLPELGEENVENITFDDIVSKLFEGRLTSESRTSYLESLILCRDSDEDRVRRQSMDFKGSRAFIRILDKLLNHYEKHVIAFEDVYFDGKIIESRQQLKNFFLNNKIGIPMARRLKRMERMILDKIHPLQRERVEKIKKIVQKSPGHDFEIKSFSRLLSIKMTQRFMGNIHKFTEVDCLEIYKRLFSDRKLFSRLAAGLELPSGIEEIILRTKERLEQGCISYEDCAPILYLKLKIEGCDIFSEIRQVVIDEAQDYYPAQYEVFKLMFKDARFTVLGDIDQSIEKPADKLLYDEVEDILHREKSVKLFLNKSYRSSVEISEFARKLLNRELDIVPFDRHEAEPEIIFEEARELMDRAVAREINNYHEEGYESVAVICKTLQDARNAYEGLKGLADIKLVDSSDVEIGKGALVIPSYMAKGLEFDAVIVYDISDDNYRSEFDRNLLYIACTRALHRLSVCYTGEKSRFLGY